ncbi:hypothetical protein EWM64_g4032 [Hericium alpestre]|uniref:ABC transporter domain-containing protein n=1 Tax=Hericium alpestre TaxID=135208 RepID=A0A4Z0A0M4_9AGAM|nr:hypothetical protein EWM64_g4032 [Hericium alpestre]
MAQHVGVDHFDPDGVEQLRRTITLMSNAEEFSGSRDSVDSDYTLAVGKEGPLDLEKMLRLYTRKLVNSDVKMRELGVLFKDLRVVGLGASASYQHTFGSMLNPRTVLEFIQKQRNPPLRDILSGFEGVVRPGQMLLVLGSPGSGCSTLLKTLTNQRAEYKAVHGEVLYDSFTPEQVAKQFRGDVIYCPEDDIHFPMLTVDQTLRFAATTRTPRARHDAISRDNHVQLITEGCEAVFGLRHVKDTPVGDESIRGVSGGEKKRVSISEAMAARALISAWDNSTRGLDSSTSLEFIRALRIATDICHASMIVSIYQAGEQLYSLFDKVCVIYEGRMVYFGPANRARQYFIDMGFEPASRQTTADFLVAVTEPTARTPRAGFEHAVPRTAVEFAERFLQSEPGKLNREDMDSYRNDFVGKSHRASAFMESVHAERARMMRKASPYTISLPMQAKATIIRRLQILKGNYMLEVTQFSAFTVMGVVVGTIFLKTSETTSEFFSRGGVLFFSLLFSTLAAMAELPSLFAQRPIVARHYRAAMYHPFLDSVALSLVDLPISLLTMGVFAVVVYFIVGLQKTAGQFFTFLLLLCTMSMVMKTWFRSTAAMFGSPAPVQGLVGLILLTLALYTGYTIPRPSIIGALRWISWISPAQYGFEAIMANEFHTLNGSCSTLIPSGPGYENVSLVNQVCTTVGSQPGHVNVDGNIFLELSYGYKHSHLWRNFGILIAFLTVFFIVLFVSSELNTSVAGSTTAMLFKRGAKVAGLEEPSSGDEEKGPRDSDVTGPTVRSKTVSASKEKTAMKDVFTWRHLNYTVPVGGEEKERKLLNDVSGFVVPGKLTALMGESGAGKTTLLNVLAQRTSSGVVTGDRLVNGCPLPADFQSQTGYVQQMDTHLASSSVREALLFSAKLRQPPSVPLEEKEAYVESVLEMCGLTQYADAIVGSLGIELRKRTTIAVELAAKPKLLLFLDEPTSGLDSQSAWSIMRFLRGLADRGQAILCTIHQPSAELFATFDRLLLLQRGGKTAYFGDLGEHAATLLGYFQVGGARPCQEDENPAEYMLDVIGAGATSSSKIDWHDVWIHSNEMKSVQQEIETLVSEVSRRSVVQTDLHTEFSTSWTFQVRELMKREAQRHWRDPMYLLSKLILNAVGGLFIGFTFFKSKNSMLGMQNKIFANFLSTVVSVPLAQQLQVKFFETRTVYEIRERPSRMYSWTALLTAQFVTELPLDIIAGSVFFICWYWTVGFPTDRAGYAYLVLGVVFPAYYVSLGQAAAAMSPSADVAGLMFTVLYAFTLAFNGILQTFAKLGWWKWMYRVSPFSYLAEGLIGQVEFVTVVPPSGMSCMQYLGPFIAGAGGYLSNPDDTAACLVCPVSSSDQYLAQNFNIFYDNHWRDFGLLLVYVAFNTAAIFALTYVARIRKFNPLDALKSLVARR